MMLPLDVIAVAQARQEAFERELRIQRLMAGVPKSPALWRTVVGRGLIWAGVRLVNWGTGIKFRNYSRGVEFVG